MEKKLFSRITKDVAITSSICGYNHFSDPALFDNDKVIGYVVDEKTGLRFKKVDDNFDLNNYNVCRNLMKDGIRSIFSL